MDLSSRNKINPAFNMSSMTDLVFLLLIFFIILSTMVSPYALPVDLPSGSTKITNTPPVALRIGDDLTYSVGNNIIPKEQVESELRAALSVREKKSIILKIDKSVPTGNTVEVLDIAKRNKWTIVIATKPN